MQKTVVGLACLIGYFSCDRLQRGGTIQRSFAESPLKSRNVTRFSTRTGESDNRFRTFLLALGNGGPRSAPQRYRERIAHRHLMDHPAGTMTSKRRSSLKQFPRMSLSDTKPSRRKFVQLIAATSSAGLTGLGMEGSAGARGLETTFEESIVWQPRSKNAPRVAKTSYQLPFITYLTRFLLNYDRGCASWFLEQARQLPLLLDVSAVRIAREKHFGQLSESVEVGLQNYQGNEGVRSMFSLLRSRYGTTPEAKIQLALLFSLISEANQPKDLISRALAEADNAVIMSIEVTSPGSGYGKDPPAVLLSLPDAEKPKRVPIARAQMEPTGGIFVRVVDEGVGYARPPVVTIYPPPRGGKAAEAVAKVKDGRIVSVEITDIGSGYGGVGALIPCKIGPPLDEKGNPIPNSRIASIKVELEYQVERIIVEDAGCGYARDQPVVVLIQDPQQSGGAQSGTVARGKAILGGGTDLDIEQVNGPFGSEYLFASVSADLVRLIPASVRPFRGANGRFTFPSSSASSPLLLQPSAQARATSAYARLLGSSASELPFFNTQPGLSFGPLGTSPVQREVPLGFNDYFRFAAAGALCTSFVRTVLVPLDVSKTLMQMNPDKYPALKNAVSSLWEEGGWFSLYRSADVTALSGLLLGGIGFGLNEFLRRYLSSLAGPQSQTLYSVQISIVAALLSVLITCIVTCPLEVLRIRAIQNVNGDEAAEPISDEAPQSAENGPDACVDEGAKHEANSTNDESQHELTAHHGRHASGDRAGQRPMFGPYSAVRGLSTLWSEGGFPVLYSGFLVLCLRELPFQVTKFLTYDASVAAIAAVMPSLQESPYLSLIAGSLAGVAAAAVSTPPDTLLTLSQDRSLAVAGEGAADEAARPSLGAIFFRQLQTDPFGLFRGLLPRCLFFGALIAGQFLLYDFLKTVFEVSPNNLNYVLDVFADRLSFYEDYK